MGKVESKTAGRSSSSSSSFRIYFCTAEIRPESAVWTLIIKEKVNRQFDRGLFDRRNDRRNDRRTESLGPPFLFSRKIKGLDDLNLDCPRLLTPYSLYPYVYPRSSISFEMHPTVVFATLFLSASFVGAQCPPDFKLEPKHGKVRSVSQLFVI